jgi:predicted nuclease of predicted toxin-antitoxin system
MKLQLDQGLPRTAAELLRAAGFDTVHVGDIGYATADDTVILQLAATDQRVVVTYAISLHGAKSSSIEAP